MDVQEESLSANEIDSNFSGDHIPLLNENLYKGSLIQKEGQEDLEENLMKFLHKINDFTKESFNSLDQVADYLIDLFDKYKVICVDLKINSEKTDDLKCGNNDKQSIENKSEEFEKNKDLFSWISFNDDKLKRLEFDNKNLEEEIDSKIQKLKEELIKKENELTKEDEALRSKVTEITTLRNDKFSEIMNVEEIQEVSQSEKPNEPETMTDDSEKEEGYCLQPRGYNGVPRGGDVNSDTSRIRLENKQEPSISYDIKKVPKDTVEKKNLKDFNIPAIFSDSKNHMESLEEVNKIFCGILSSSVSISIDMCLFRCARDIVTSFYEPFDQQIYPKIESNLQFDSNEKTMTNCFCNALNIIGEKSYIFIEFFLDDFLEKTFLYLERLFQFVSKNIFAGRIAEVILYCLCNVLKDKLLKEDSYSDLLWKYFKNSISSKLIELGSAVLFCSFLSKSERLEKIKSVLNEVYDRNKEAKEYLGFSLQEIDDARKKKGISSYKNEEELKFFTNMNLETGKRIKTVEECTHYINSEDDKRPLRHLLIQIEELEDKIYELKQNEESIKIMCDFKLNEWEEKLEGMLAEMEILKTENADSKNKCKQYEGHIEICETALQYLKEVKQTMENTIKHLEKMNQQMNENIKEADKNNEITNSVEKANINNKKLKDPVSDIELKNRDLEKRIEELTEKHNKTIQEFRYKCCNYEMNKQKNNEIMKSKTEIANQRVKTISDDFEQKLRHNKMHIDNLEKIIKEKNKTIKELKHENSQLITNVKDANEGIYFPSWWKEHMIDTKTTCPHCCKSLDSNIPYLQIFERLRR